MSKTRTWKLVLQDPRRQGLSSRTTHLVSNKRPGFLEIQSCQSTSHTLLRHRSRTRTRTWCPRTRTWNTKHKVLTQIAYTQSSKIFEDLIFRGRGQSKDKNTDWLIDWLIDWLTCWTISAVEVREREQSDHHYLGHVWSLFHQHLQRRFHVRTCPSRLRHVRLLGVWWRSSRLPYHPHLHVSAD